MPFEPLNIEDLRIGHYVKLECSWWKHPFATNMFKVTTRTELRRIKKITKLQLFFDPDLSDPSPEEDELPSHELSSPDSDVQSDIESVEGSFEQEPQGELEEEKEETPRFLPEDGKSRREILRERRSQLKKTERAYAETAKQTKAALKNMTSGDVAGLRMAENMLLEITKMLKADRSVMAILEVMNSTDLDDPFFVHAMNVCVLSMLVGNIMGLEEEELVSLGLGAIAHDIGYLNLPRELELTTSGFTREGAKTKLHIQQGLIGIGRISKFPEAGVQIIAQHHERLNGKGYPDGLTQDQISPLAKIVMIIDEYDELCHGQGQELTPYEALSLMYQNTSVKKKCEYDENILIQLIKSLGVYPPGTLVELNDGSIGVVISINPQDRTNPQIMIYVPGVPQDEATIVDLSQDEDLTIEKSLRPKELSKEAKRYLNPSRATGFFPSSSEISLFAQTQ